jgi:urease accessory protein
LHAARANALLEAARESATMQAAGATCLQQRLVVLRALADRTEPLIALAQAVRAHWRMQAWSLPDTRPRVWRT